MSLESKVFNTLLDSATVIAALSSCVFPEKRPQGSALPAAVFYRAPGGERVNSLKGFSGLENAMIEIEVSASSVQGRREGSEAVIFAMCNATRFTCIMPDPPVDEYDDETQVYLRTCQFSVWTTAAA